MMPAGTAHKATSAICPDCPAGPHRLSVIQIATKMPRDRQGVGTRTGIGLSSQTPAG